MCTVKNHLKQISDISQSFASFEISNTVFAQEKTEKGKYVHAGILKFVQGLLNTNSS